MDADEARAYLAQTEGAHVRPIRDPEGDERQGAEAPAIRVPWFRIGRDAMGRLVASGHAFVGHDNEPRMPFLVQWLQRRVLPLVDAEADVTGCYRVELHDSYSYLPTRGMYDNVLTFARPQGARERVGLIPDPYQVAAYGGATDVPDGVRWEAKHPTLFFAGATTGARDPAVNARIRACLWSLQQPTDVAHMRITSVVQMPPDLVRRAVPRLDDILAPHVPLQDHHLHRYQVNIVGNTACWSRVPMVMASRSVLFHVRHPDGLWYYPLLRDGEHYVGVDSLDALLGARRRCEADPRGCARMADAANAFVRQQLQPRHADTYMAQFLEAAAWFGRA